MSDIEQIKAHLVKLRNDGSYGPWLDAAILAMDNLKVAGEENERLRTALTEIAERGHIITYGDCAVLRNRARDALGLEHID